MKKLAPMSQPLLSKPQKPMGLKSKLKYHLWALPRWFATPFFISSLLLGVVLAGGNLANLRSWLAAICGAFVMAGGHSFNSLLDYSWTGLDKGEVEDRSAEKAYTGGQNLLANGLVSPREVLVNALAWYVASAVVLIFINTSLWILLVWALGCLTTVAYSKSKFNWTHELVLGASVGPLAVLLGMYAVNPNPPVLTGIIVSVPVAIVLSFLGLSLDEWPDSEANLKKGVKSMAFYVWKISEGKIEGLWFYCLAWLSFLMAYQVFLIDQGYLKITTAATFAVIVAFIPALMFLKMNFRKTMAVIIPIAGLYPILLLVGQIVGK